MWNWIRVPASLRRSINRWLPATFFARCFISPAAAEMAWQESNDPLQE
jgi:hypothetical protein